MNAVAITRNPATGVQLAIYPFHTDTEIEALLEASVAACRQWRATAMSERVAKYRRLVVILRERVERLASLITAEMGKPLAEARAEVEKCAVTLDWLCAHGPAILMDEQAPVDGPDDVYVSYLPIGTVLAVMPWNFPLWQVIRASGPIMLSGNGFILKHAPNVMGSAYALQDAYEAAGFPAGLFATLLTDNDKVARIIEDRRIAAVTLTGSTRAGAAVASCAARVLKKSLLELGGSDAFIVLADADIDGAVRAGIRSRFHNASQVCLAAKRFILERSIAEEFTRKFVAAARQLTTGDPLDPATNVGPMARTDLRDELHGQVERTLAAGADAVLGGRKLDGPGNFYAPTVLTGVVPGMAAFDEETFGPVAALCDAADAEEAIVLANTSTYGLGGNVWTQPERGAAIARQLDTGGVFVNGFIASDARIPVGGIKQSGYGRELSHFGLREFTNAQAVWVKKHA